MAQAIQVLKALLVRKEHQEEDQEAHRVLLVHRVRQDSTGTPEIMALKAIMGQMDLRAMMVTMGQMDLKAMMVLRAIRARKGKRALKATQGPQVQTGRRVLREAPGLKV